MTTDSRTGEPITAAQARNGAFIWTVPNPLYFKIIDYEENPFLRPYNTVHFQIRFNHNLRKALEIHQCFLNFRVLTPLRAPTWRFLRIFSRHVLGYLNNLGVISLNDVINAVDYVLYDVFNNTLSVSESHIIKFNLY
uniref:Replication enhancer n=1 Tax=Lindernia anagallis yellow vein virus TaxID=300411 RepID=Q5RZ90_9GEMI|nr:replication enhancer protein [Lindernia anagallis yellow vein virus]